MHWLTLSVSFSSWPTSFEMGILNSTLSEMVEKQNSRSKYTYCMNSKICIKYSRNGHKALWSYIKITYLSRSTSHKSTSRMWKKNRKRETCSNIIPNEKIFVTLAKQWDPFLLQQYYVCSWNTDAWHHRIDTKQLKGHLQIAHIIPCYYYQIFYSYFCTIVLLRLFIHANKVSASKVSAVFSVTLYCNFHWGSVCFTYINAVIIAF